MERAFTLKVCNTIWTESGYEVVGTTLAAKIASELEEGTGIKVAPRLTSCAEQKSTHGNLKLHNEISRRGS